MILPLSVLIAHFIADYMLQSDKMALKKSHDWGALTTHVTIYTAFLGLWSIGHLPGHLGGFMVLTFLSHFLTDAVTSRITSKLWFIKLVPQTVVKHGEAYPYYATVGTTRHWFFVVLGLDQVIHYTTLALTIKLLS